MDMGVVGRAELERPRRRVREEVLDGFAVMAFSAAASSALAFAALLIARLAG
jgi:hypothetical protein